MSQEPRRRVFGLRRFILLLGLGLGLWLWLGRNTPVQIEDGSALLIELSGDYVEAPNPSYLAKALGGDGKPFHSLMEMLGRAERDSRIDTVVLHIRGLAIGWGKANEIRDAIGRLRGSGHRVIAYLELESFSMSREYYIATAANEILVVPGSVTPLVGLAAEYLYLGGMWETLGIEIQATRAGKYKSAVETMTAREMSEASREMFNSLLDGAERRFVMAIAEGRGLTPEEVREIIDRGLVSPHELLAVKLIDGIRHLDASSGVSGEVVREANYERGSLENLGLGPKTRLALIYGSGSVVSGWGRRSVSGGPVFASEEIRDALFDAARDPEIAGIVMRIDSGGGSPLASEVMWSAVRRVRKQGTPVVVSISDVAASGAYYVASAADAIVISPSALTGSIGVFAMRWTFEGLFDKLGIGVSTLTRGRFADFNLSTSRLSAAASDRMNRITQEIYRKFVARVAEGRNLSEEQVDAVAQGRVWSGEQALEVGLVDELGGMNEAVKRMLRILELDEETEVSLVVYPEPPSLAQELAQIFQSRAVALAPEAAIAAAIDEIVPLPVGLRQLGHWLLDLPLGGPLLIPAVWVNIR